MQNSEAVMSTVAMPQEQTKRMRFKHILMATDFSITSCRALAYALAMARYYGSEITIVHAIPPKPHEPIPMDASPGEMNREQLQAKEKLRRLAEEAGIREVRHKAEAMRGNVADVLSSIIERDHSDLLVLGTHGRGAVKTLALGSFAEQALRTASCPVLTVGPHVSESATEVVSFRSILFATDFGPASGRAVPVAFALAEDHRAKLVLFHIPPPVPVEEIGPAAYLPGEHVSEDPMAWRVREETLRNLNGLIPADSKLVSRPAYIGEASFVPDGILDAAKIYRSDLIVMGAKQTRSPRMAAHFPWAVIHGVLCGAKCPVLTVRG